MQLNKLTFFILTLLIYSCQSEKTMDNAADLTALANSFSINWELIKNETNDKAAPQQHAIFTIHNTGDIAIKNNWTLYFNQINGPISGSSITGNANLKHINGDFYKLAPATDFKAIEANQKLEIAYLGLNWATKAGDAPSGLYLVFTDENGKESTPFALKNYTVTPFTKPEQINRMATDKYPIPTNEFRFNQNEKLKKLDKSAILSVIPSPVKLVKGKSTVTIDKDYIICYDAQLEGEAAYLKSELKALGLDLTMQKGGTCDNAKSIRLALSSKSFAGKKAEAYRLNIANGISIEGTDAAGVFYAIQSLRALIPNEALAAKKGAFQLAQLTIEDAPRFAYRGLHFDVSRNFHTKETVMKLLDLMGTYKLNKFHFHLTDDEGWRLEIPALPELTEVGAKRGHTTDESDKLQPAYGSGPFADNAARGSGFYTSADYIEILKYAQARHIEVIPEIDLPGHARAAIIAMKARQKRLLAAGKKEEAGAYLLHDAEDKSVYSSAQVYNDNIICVCKESVYSFIEVVVDEVIALHNKANVPLKVLHTGGDEVPAGVWEKSPICDEFLKNNPSVRGDKIGLTNYFMKRFGDILAERKLVTGGWEEIALAIEEDEKGHHIRKPNMEFVNSNFLPYVWNAVFGWGGEDIAYQLANVGYNVVLCNASNLYFDLSYGKDPEDAGLYWAGYVDTRKTYEFMPLDLFKTAKMGKFGEELSPSELAKGKVALNPNAIKNVLGIQGQLWSETLISTERLEYATYPKLLGLAERAWAAQPNWSKSKNENGRFAGLDKSWNQFSNTLGQKEMTRLDYIAGGVKYRIPPAGAKIEDGKLFANTAFPGLTIRYTLDGSEPTENSLEYTQPVEVQGDVRVKVFSGGGNASRSVLVKKGLVN